MNDVEFQAEVEVEEDRVADGSIGKVWASKFLENIFIYFFIITFEFRYNVLVTSSRYVIY